jgi:hypothetical protein
MITVTIENNGEKKDFFIHHGVLCFHSKYFNKLINGSFSESKSHVQTFKDHDIITIKRFQVFHDWVYLPHLGLNSDLMETSYEELVRLYRLADYIQVDRLKNLVLQMYFCRFIFAFEIDVDLATELYDCTPRDFALRLLFVDILIETGDEKFFDDLSPETPPDFLYDIIRRSVKGNQFLGKSCLTGKLNARVSYFERKKSSFCERYHEHTHALDSSHK